MIHPSQDGKGRTIFEILTGKNKKDLTPLELQYHNPLQAKVGCTMQLASIPDYHGINFAIEGIHVYKTEIGNKTFFHTDYCCKGNAIDWPKPVRFRLRLIPDEDSVDELGHKFQLLFLYDEFAWDEGFESLCENNGDHDSNFDEEGEVTFKINHDDEGNELETPYRYWRVEDVPDPYHARVTSLLDDDGSGTIEDDELEHHDAVYWDFNRIMTDEQGNQEEEFVWIEKDDKTGYFTILRGLSVRPDSVFVI